MVETVKTDQDALETLPLVVALQHSELLAALVDPQRRMRWANEAFKVRWPRDTTLRVEHDARAVDLPDGSRLWLTPTPLPDGWLLLVASDVTSLRPNETVTGGFTAPMPLPHDPILDLAESALRDARRKRRFLTIGLIELEGPASPEQLHRFAAHCQHRLRPGDRLGSLGGTRFLLLLPGAAQHAASIVMQRLRQPTSLLPGTPANERHFRFSAGLGSLEEADTWPTLLQRAERALTAAKAGGGNCTVPRA